MIKFNEMKSHSIVKTHLNCLLQSVQAGSPDEDIYKNAIDQIDHLSSKANDNNDKDDYCGAVIITEVNILKKVLQLKTNTMKTQTLQAIESIIADEEMKPACKLLILTQIEEIAQYSLQFNEGSLNAILLSIMSHFIKLSSCEYSIRGILLYDIFNICVDVYLKSVNERKDDNTKNASQVMEGLINMLIFQSKNPLMNKGSSHIQILTKEKWLNKIQKDALSKYMEHYIDTIELDLISKIPLNKNSLKFKRNPSAPTKKSINEKGIESGRCGFCINCRNQASFYSSAHSFPFCSSKCYNEMMILIKTIDITLPVENTPISDLINLIALLSQLVSINSKYIWEYKETTISQMKYHLMALIYLILPHLLNEPNANKEELIGAIKGSLYPHVIISSALSLNFDTFASANKLMLLLLESSYKEHLKEEIGLYVEKVYLYYLQAENAPMNYKLTAVESLSRLTDKSFAFELFINYDCDLYSKNLYYDLLGVVTKIINGLYDKKSGLTLIEGEDMVLSQKEELRLQCLDLISKLIYHLDSIVHIEPKEIILKKDRRSLPSDIEITLSNASLERENHKSSKECSRNRPTSEVIQRIVYIKDCFRKATEKFNINPLNSLKYLVSKDLVASDALFNYYKHKWDNRPVLFIDSSEEDNKLHSNNISNENNYFLHYLLHFGKCEERIFSFFTKYSTDNELLTYDHYSSYEIACFIHYNLSSINKSQLTVFICSSKQFSLHALFYFIQLFSFSNYHITEALRLLFQKLPIIKEPQIIQLIVRLFAIKYNRDNVNWIKFPEQTMSIALSAIELSEEVMKNDTTNSKTLSDYIEKAKTSIKSETLDLSFLCDVYNKVITTPLCISYLDTNLNVFTQAQYPDEDKPKECLIELMKKEKEVNDSDKLYHVERNTDDIINLIQCSWSYCLGVFSQMLNEHTNKQIIQKCINNILTFARISGILHLYTISDTFINTIINLTSIREVKELQPKNIQSLRSFLSFVLASGKYISSSWYSILCLLSRIDYYNSEQLVQSIERKIAEALAKHIPYHLIESVYSCTILFPSKQLNDFMLSLCEVVRFEIGTKITRAFSLHKIIEVANFNLFRSQIELESIWRIIYESFISLISEYKNAHISICTNVIDSLRQIAIKFLNKSEIGNNFQLELFKPFDKLFNKSSAKEGLTMPEMILECVTSISNSFPGLIGLGWVVIFDIIKSAVKRKEEKINSLLLSTLKPFDENMISFCSNKAVFTSYVKCLCYLSLYDEMKAYSLMRISKALQQIFQQLPPPLLNIKWLLYGLDEVLRISPSNYTELVFELLTKNTDYFFASSFTWEYCYYSYFKVHLVTIVLYCFVYRLNLWEKDIEDDIYSRFKEETKEIHLNVLLYLTNTSRNSISTSLDYRSDSDLIIAKAEYLRKYDLIQYTTLIESFIERLFDLINRALSNKRINLQFFIEDIIISLLQLSLFNETPETLFSIILKALLTYKEQISLEGWKKIGSTSFYILHSLSCLNEALTESQMKDIAAYSYYYSLFFKHLLINFFKEVGDTEVCYKLHFVCCNKVLWAFLLINQNNKVFKEFNLLKSQFAMGTLSNLTKCQTLILEKTTNVLSYYDKSIICSIELLHKAFVDYLLHDEEKSQLIDVIQIEIQSILPKFIKAMNTEEIQIVFSFVLDILMTKNKALREFAKLIIELLMDNGMMSFTSIKIFN